MIKKATIWLVVLLVLSAGAGKAIQSGMSPDVSAQGAETPQKRITFAQAVVLGIVEGLTEYLPVSSTGHLILAGHAMDMTDLTGSQGLLGPQIRQSDSISAYQIVIQLGAILAVVGLYRRRVGQMFRGLVGRDRAGLRLSGMLLIAFIPSAVVGLAIHGWIKEHLFSPQAVSLALLAGGLAMILVPYFVRRKPPGQVVSKLEDVTWPQALTIGLFQCFALWPGTSRSMVTIIAAVIVGLDLVRSAEFSFLLALPTLGAATVFEGVKSWPDLTAAAGPEGLIVGLVVSWIVAVLAVKGFVRWLTNHGLMPFGIYRILLAGGILVFYLLRA